MSRGFHGHRRDLGDRDIRNWPAHSRVEAFAKEIRSGPLAEAQGPGSGPDLGRGRRKSGVALVRYVEAARLAHELGLGVNAGHDLDLRNLTLFRTLPHLDEVSIGHALVGRALFVGLGRVVREYIAVLDGVGA